MADEKFDRVGAKILLKKGVTKVVMCRILGISRPWLNELLTTRDALGHPAMTKEANSRIQKMLHHLANVRR